MAARRGGARRAVRHSDKEDERGPWSSSGGRDAARRAPGDHGVRRPLRAPHAVWRLRRPAGHPRAVHRQQLHVVQRRARHPACRPLALVRDVELRPGRLHPRAALGRRRRTAQHRHRALGLRRAAGPEPESGDQRQRIPPLHVAVRPRDRKERSQDGAAHDLAAPRSASEGVTTANLSAAYRAAGAALGAKVAPAGEAFAEAQLERPDLVLNNPDGHPTRLGSYLAACVVYDTIFGPAPSASRMPIRACRPSCARSCRGSPTRRSPSADGGEGSRRCAPAHATGAAATSCAGAERSGHARTHAGDLGIDHEPEMLRRRHP